MKERVTGSQSKKLKIDPVVVVQDVSVEDNGTCPPPPGQANETSQATRKTMERMSLDNDQDRFITLPPEVLEHLFKFIPPRDKFTVSRASAVSDQELHRSKRKWLFYKVFENLVLLGHLSNADDIRNCRLVCRDWNFAFQHFVDEGNYSRPDYSAPCYRSLLCPATGSYPRRLTDPLENQTPIPWVSRLSPRSQLYPPSSSQLNKFVRLAEQRASVNFNPFVSRTMDFKTGTSDDPETWNELYTVLDRFGRELRVSKISHFASERSAVFERVKEALERMPHLNTLICKLTNFGRNFWGADPPALPPLPSLKCLNLFTDQLACNYPIQPFAVYFGQLVSLEMGHDSGFLDWYNPFVHSGFPNLKHLSVWSAGGGADLFKLQRMGCCSLKELEIGSNRASCCISPTVYFHVAEAFSETLVALKIKKQKGWVDCIGPLKTMAHFALPEPDKIRLPHMKILVMDVRNCGCEHMDPLLKLVPAPEYLELVIWQCYINKIHRAAHNAESADARASDVLQIYQHLEGHGDLYDSNVWTLLQQLDEIRVGRPDSERIARRSKQTAAKFRKVFTRFGYEQQLEKKSAI